MQLLGLQPYEGVHTDASWPAILAICAVAVGGLAFLLVAVAYADAHPRVAPRWQPPEPPGPVAGGSHTAAGGRSVAPSRDSSAVPGEDFFTDLAAARPGTEQAEPFPPQGRD
jgi:hypothetical protein